MEMFMEMTGMPCPENFPTSSSSSYYARFGAGCGGGFFFFFLSLQQSQRSAFCFWFVCVLLNGIPTASIHKLSHIIAAIAFGFGDQHVVEYVKWVQKQTVLEGFLHFALARFLTVLGFVWPGAHGMLALWVLHTWLKPLCGRFIVGSLMYFDAGVEQDLIKPDLSISFFFQPTCISEY